MKCLYVEPLGGLAGDMWLGALLAVSRAETELRGLLATLPLRADLEVRPARRGGVQALHVSVRAPEAGRPRRLPDLERLLSGSPLTAAVRERSLAVFRRLAEAEARVHGTEPHTVTLHEVGMEDALVEVVGTSWLLERLEVRAVYVAPPSLGRGETGGHHGRLPVPAPAVLELLRGAPVAFTERAGERVTPTGAALAVTFAAAFGPPPPGRLLSVGYGAGARDVPGEVNALRATVLETAGPGAADWVVVLETALDDLTPEMAGHAAERLRQAGALDVYWLPGVMKKGRPGLLLTVLCPLTAEGTVTETLFRETSAFGVRRRLAERRLLERTTVPVETPWGPVRVKVGSLGGEVVRAAPEYEDCRRVARSAGRPLREVYAAALAAWEARPGA